MLDRSSSFGISPPGRYPHLVSNPEFHSFRKLTQGGIERVGNLPQPPHRRVDDPSLDPADVRSVETARAAEALLRVAGPLPEFSYNSADRSQSEIARVDLLFAPLHQQIRWCYVEAYQPTAYMPHLQGSAGARVRRNLKRNVARSRSDVVFLRTWWTSRFSH